MNSTGNFSMDKLIVWKLFLMINIEDWEKFIFLKTL
jgi:hypothetical protein